MPRQTLINWANWLRANGCQDPSHLCRDCCWQWRHLNKFGLYLQEGKHTC